MWLLTGFQQVKGEGMHSGKPRRVAGEDHGARAPGWGSHRTEAGALQDSGCWFRRGAVRKQLETKPGQSPRGCRFRLRLCAQEWSFPRKTTQPVYSPSSGGTLAWGSPFILKGSIPLPLVPCPAQHLLPGLKSAPGVVGLYVQGCPPLKHFLLFISVPEIGSLTHGMLTPALLMSGRCCE